MQFTVMNGDVRRLENAVCVVFYFLVQIGIGADMNKIAVGIRDRIHRFAIPVLHRIPERVR